MQVCPTCNQPEGTAEVCTCQDHGRPVVTTEVVPVSSLRAAIEQAEGHMAEAIQQKLDETEGMAEPHQGHMLRVKMLSLVSALTPTKEPGT
jgi:hypothetical protein